MIVIIDYGLGNLHSIANMLKKIGAPNIISSDPAVIEQADKLILPGVGSFDNGMRNINQSGILPVITRKAFEGKTPVLGICLGMQLLTKASDEGTLPGLGWIDAKTRRFSFAPDSGLKIPHMGWNTITVKDPNHPLCAGFDEEMRYYFVHSYYVECADTADILTTTHYGYDFASSVSHGNIMGTQFHPEKSHTFGMRLLRNFAAMGEN